jgi:multimeric flavodoxin WrbA
MKVIAINGSSRKDGNTSLMIKEVFKVLEEYDIQTQEIQLAGERIRGCMACDLCARNKDRKCAIDDDILNSIIEKMSTADGIILGSPVYFANVTPEIKAFIDRAGRVVRVNDYMMKGKVGAAVVAVRRAGSLPTFDALNHFFFVEQMIVPGSTYWNLGIGRDIGEVGEDKEGMDNMKNLGENIAWLLEKLHS